MIRTELATIAPNFAADTLIRVVMTDGTDLTVVSTGRTNSKGLVVRHSAEEPVFYIAPSKIDRIEDPTADADADGMTTAELAAIFGTERKTLRVALRKLGLGVGKGRMYHLNLNTDLRSKIQHTLAELGA